MKSNKQNGIWDGSNVKISSWNWLNVKNKEFWVFLIIVAPCGVLD
jgi:hypothetical protein